MGSSGLPYWGSSGPPPRVGSVSKVRKLAKFDHLNYIRFVTGGTHNGVKVFALDQRFCDIFVQNLDHYRDRFAYKLFGFVIMPDHFHLLLLPKVEDKLSKILMSLKGYTARKILDVMKGEGRVDILAKLRLTRRGSKGTKASSFAVFQPDNYVFNVFSLGKLREKLDYMHNNPVKAGLVKHPGAYRWSSFACYTGNGTSIIEMDELDGVF